MFLNYIYPGISLFKYLLPYVLIIFCILYVVKILFKFLSKRQVEFKPIQMLCEFLWIFTVLGILEITGIIGGNFGSTSIFAGNSNISISFFEEGLSPAMVFNGLVFIPFGFFSACIFNLLRTSWIRVILLGLIFSVIIELLQTFIGRFAQLDDILMNTIGTGIGYGIWFIFLGLNRKIQSKGELYKKS